MCQRLAQLTAAMREYSTRFDASLLSAADAASVVQQAAAVEHMASAVKSLAAARAAQVQSWKASGHRSAEEQLAHCTGTSVAGAREALALGRRLDQQPEVAAAALSGTLSPTQASAIADAVDAAPAAAGELLEAATAGGSLADLKDQCAAVKAAAEVDLEARRAAIRRRRNLRAWTDQGGEWHLVAAGNPEDGAQIMAALAPLAEQVFRLARQAGVREHPNAYRFDALVQLALNATSPTATDAHNAAGACEDGQGPGGDCRELRRSRPGRRPRPGRGPPPAVPTPTPRATQAPTGTVTARCPTPTPTPRATQGRTGTATARVPTITRRGQATAVAARQAAGSTPVRLHPGPNLRRSGHRTPRRAQPAPWREPDVEASRPTADVAGTARAPDTAPPGGRGGPPRGKRRKAARTTPRARRGAPTKLLLRVDLDAFLRGFPTGGETCDLVGYGPISLSAVQDILRHGDPFVAAILTRATQVVGVAHLGRQPTASQRSVLEWLHPTCAASGCACTARLEIDHRVDWADTHITLIDWLDALCHHHHQLKTQHGWALVDGVGKRAFVGPTDPRNPRHRPSEAA